MRRKAGLTQEQVAGKLGLANETLSRIERGRHWVRLDNLDQMARLYGVSLADVFAAATGDERSAKVLLIEEILDVLRKQPETKLRQVRDVLYPLVGIERPGARGNRRR